MIVLAPVAWLLWRFVFDPLAGSVPAQITSMVVQVELIVWWLSHLLSVRGLARGRRVYLQGQGLGAGTGMASMAGEGSVISDQPQQRPCGGGAGRFRAHPGRRRQSGIQELLQDGLSGAGFEVLSASDASEGIARFLEGRPDAVLVDVLMPGMDGYELCQRLRELTDVPIMMISALRNEAEIVKGLDAGADDYVTKPFSVAELTARMRAHLRRRRRPDTPSARSPSTAGAWRSTWTGSGWCGTGRTCTSAPPSSASWPTSPSTPGRVIPHRELITQVWGADGAAWGRTSRSTSAGCGRRSRPTPPIPSSSSPATARGTPSRAPPRNCAPSS